MHLSGNMMTLDSFIRCNVTKQLRDSDSEERLLNAELQVRSLEM